ncbi:LamG-like jellyroll fold domain-containing protein [Catenovulum agarivorans]|uniref:LamG-like jellyroll fold domain-containing protein n=1 Tax=Catenovulum agarivorans TaxID=1172192 RepID=UPI0003123047|nr:LamG-like jellyroll fold domain-containing protein [Catenovulum agarivorans]
MQIKWQSLHHNSDTHTQKQPKHRIITCVKKPLVICCSLLLASQTLANEQTIVFDTQANGEYKGIDLWGLDTAWLWDLNVIRGVNYTGKQRTDVIRFSFTGDTPLTDSNGDGINDELTGEGLTEFNTRMALVDTYTDAHTQLYLNTDTENWTSNPYLVGDGVDAVKWAELIAITTRKAQQAGRQVISVAPFNEPDHGTWQGDVTRFGDVAWQLRNNPNFPEFNTGASNPIRLMGGNTLDNSNAASWYNTLNGWGYLEEGNTHQLAGSFDDYVSFYQSVQVNGDTGTNDELHNVAEAMIGAEYGMDVGIWWYTAERARAEFVKASDGVRLAYAENRSNWTAASVYRAPDGKIQAFVGESERQAIPMTYRFLSKDRPVFYDGHGPMHSFEITTTGDTAYWTANHHNAERVVNITWGDDVQPVIDGRYYLINRSTKLAMQVDSGEVNIGQATPSSSSNQYWDVNPTPNTVGGDYSYFSIIDVQNNMAPYVDWGNMSDGDNIATSTSVLDAKSLWFLEYVEDGWFKIGSRWSALYLTANGANVEQQADYATHEQQWRLVPISADPADFTAPAQPANLTTAANPASVTLNWNANTESDLSGYHILRSVTFGGPYEIIARNVTANAYTDNTANQTSPYYYVIEAVDNSLNRSARSAQVSATPTGNAGLIAHYTLQNNTLDGTVNNNDAVLTGAAQFVNWGAGESALNLRGGHVNLPAGIVNHPQITLATWVYWQGNTQWQRIFDFGNGTQDYLFLTPKGGDGNMQFQMLHNGVLDTLYAPELTTNQWVHVAVVVANGNAELYVDGTLAASMSTSIQPTDINPLVNFIGKSQFADPAMQGLIDDFRIYNKPLNATEIAALATSAPSDPYAPVPVTLINGDFEAGIDTRWNFTGFDSPADVPGWTDYGTNSDSGVEPSDAWWGTYQNSYSGFMQPGDAGAYLLSDYTIKAGDVFNIGFVGKSWDGASQWSATLYFDTPANVIGTYVQDVNGSWLAYDTNITATAASVGGKLGVLFVNSGSGFANIDNVAVTVSSNN